MNTNGQRPLMGWFLNLTGTMLIIVHIGNNGLEWDFRNCK